MNKYMLIFFENKNIYTDFSPEDRQKETELHIQWVEELGEHFESGEPLELSAKTVKGKDAVITDGPYIESKELVTGYYIIKANSLEEAAEFAKGFPGLRFGGTVEVREIMKI